MEENKLPKIQQALYLKINPILCLLLPLPKIWIFNDEQQETSVSHMFTGYIYTYIHCNSWREQQRQQTLLPVLTLKRQLIFWYVTCETLGFNSYWSLLTELFQLLLNNVKY